MQILISIFSLFLLLSSGCIPKEPASDDDPAGEKARVLVFSKTAGYRHESIPDGQKAIRELGAENGFSVDVTEDSGMFTSENLGRYKAVVFLNTTGDVLDDGQQAAFEQYIQAGGGFVGVHSATDTEYDWPWYGKMVGAYFEHHPNIQPAKINVVDHQHPSTSMLDSIWMRTDEWYNFKSLNPEVNVLLTLDESSYQGGTMGEYHPLAWYHEYDGGRAFYTEMGHTKETYYEPLYRKHLLGGIMYAMGEKP
jgi:type 1 glutamine amidotransferase